MTSEQLQKDIKFLAERQLKAMEAARNCDYYGKR